jgi:hypothetical protein
MARKLAASVDNRNGRDGPHENAFGPSTMSLPPTEIAQKTGGMAAHFPDTVGGTSTTAERAADRSGSCGAILAKPQEHAVHEQVRP